VDGAGPGSGAPRPEDGPPLAANALALWSAPGLILTVLAAFAAAIAASVPVVIALGIAREPAAERSAEEILLLAIASDGAMIGAIAVLGRYLLGLRPSDLGLRPPPKGALPFAVRAAGALWLLSISVNALQSLFSGPNPQSILVSLGAHSGVPAFVLDLLTGAVVAPFAEELLFRGLIYGGLAQRYPGWLAAVFSALLFALLHGVGVLVPIFVLGLGLAYVYQRTGTLWAPILTHSLVNAVSLALLFLAPRSVLGY